MAAMRESLLEGVVVLIGHAGAEDIRKRKSLVLDALLDQLREVLLVGAEGMGNERGPAASASEIGLTGASMLPKGMLFVFIPIRLVGEV